MWRMFIDFRQQNNSTQSRVCCRICELLTSTLAQDYTNTISQLEDDSSSSVETRCGRSRHTYSYNDTRNNILLRDAGSLERRLSFHRIFEFRTVWMNRCSIQKQLTCISITITLSFVITNHFGMTENRIRRNMWCMRIADTEWNKCTNKRNERKMTKIRSTNIQQCVIGAFNCLQLQKQTQPHNVGERVWRVYGVCLNEV